MDDDDLSSTANRAIDRVVMHYKKREIANAGSSSDGEGDEWTAALTPRAVFDRGSGGGGGAGQHRGGEMDISDESSDMGGEVVLLQDAGHDMPDLTYNVIESMVRCSSVGGCWRVLACAGV